MWGGGLRADTWFRAVAVRIVMDGNRVAPKSETAIRRFDCDASPRQRLDEVRGLSRERAFSTVGC